MREVATQAGFSTSAEPPRRRSTWSTKPVLEARSGGPATAGCPLPIGAERSRDIIARLSLTPPGTEAGCLWLPKGPRPGWAAARSQKGYLMTVVTMRELLEAGVHFGHQTRRWNPKMKPYIFQERNGIYIIDLALTVQKLRETYEAVKQLARERQRHPLRRHEEAGAGRRARRSRTRRHVFHQPALAGRHADQLRDHPEADRAAARARKHEGFRATSSGCPRKKSPSSRTR